MLVGSLGTNVKAESVCSPNLEPELLTAHDYNQMLGQFKQNIEAYNQLNDSLFGQYQKAEWVNTFLRRARTASNMGQTNQQMLNRLFAGFEHNIAVEHLDSLFSAQLIDLDDCFIQEEIFQHLYNHIKSLLQSDPFVLELYMATAYRLSEIKLVTSISGDEAAMEQSYQLCKDIIDHYMPGRDVHVNINTVRLYFRCLVALIGHKEYITHGFATVQEYDQLYKILCTSFSSSLKDYLVPAQQQIIRSQIEQYQMSMLRNVYMPDTTHCYDAVCDSLMSYYVGIYNAHPEYEAKSGISTQRRLIIMRQRLGQITTSEALSAMHTLSRKISSNGLSEDTLCIKINTLLECVYLVDISNLTFAQKCTYVEGYCNEILSDLSHLHYQNNMPALARTLKHVAVYKRIHRYLTTPQRKHLLETLLFYSQPFTRAHSETVALLAQTILNAVIQTQPQMLKDMTGMLGYKTVRQMQRKPQALQSFFTEAVRYHDLGKTRMPDIVRNEYRQLTNHEFAILRRHPEFGLEYLTIDSTLLPMHDIVLGHHKWYNGQGGYPEYFDNTQSPYRVLIDILTLADCLEAATSRLGRNYRKNKHYADVLAEFNAEAGTRYNPQLVHLLETHPTLGAQLNEICERGWEDVYYRVFNMK